ncbi:MAG: ATP-binding protein [Phycisphaerae bacterium]|nr:ATP-binding protein [Phycisphaerae bacterium]
MKTPLIERKGFVEQIHRALGRSPIIALMGPRQCGKTTLAHMVCDRWSGDQASTYFDLESQVDLRRLANPEMVLGSLTGLTVIDEIQTLPGLFSVLRVLVDRPDNPCRFLILGSASPHVVRNVSETLAGRVEFVDLAGFDLGELGPNAWQPLWVRGGFPRSYLAQSEDDSFAWREGFIRTFLQRDIPQLGIRIGAAAMRRFWTMLAHYHGQIWNASQIAIALGLSDKTIRSYLDLLSETYMLRQLQPWHENLRKRQVRSPKVYFRDTGLLHSLLDLRDFHGIVGHPQAGASWEGFAIEQVLRIVRPAQAYFWATYSGAELDLFFIINGRRYGVECKFSEAPHATKSMSAAVESLKLDKLLVVYPGNETWPLSERITACPVCKVPEWLEQSRVR